jgi:hypothetical protein
VGANQPRISEPFPAPRYDNAVCPNGSNAPELCDPNISTNRIDETTGTTDTQAIPNEQAPESTAPGEAPPTGEEPVPGLDLPGGTDELDDLLDIPGATEDGGPLPEGLEGDASGGDQATEDLIDFLFSN